LPTEAEWEKAAGWDEEAQMQRLYLWGDTIDEIDYSYANFGGAIGDTSSPTSNPLGPNSGAGRVMRGSSWGNSNIFLGLASRFRADLAEARDNLGFRCARDAE
jgi:formylglycine-generating enzyme required for sulfatase activity